VKLESWQSGNTFADFFVVVVAVVVVVVVVVVVLLAVVFAVRSLLLPLALYCFPPPPCWRSSKFLKDSVAMQQLLKKEIVGWF